MEDQAWRSVDVVETRQGTPHVLQQRVSVYTAGVGAESSDYAKPEVQHRLAPFRSLVELDGE